MKCFLSVRGRDFDIDKFLSKSPWGPAVHCWRRAAPIESEVGQKLAGRKTLRDSGFQLAASQEGDDSEIKTQVRQVVRFLERHSRELRRLKRAKGVESKQLNFGIIWPRNAAIVWRLFSAELIRSAGKFDLEIEFSVYGATQFRPLRKKPRASSPKKKSSLKGSPATNA